MSFKVGDQVKVNDPTLETLRRLCPSQKPNHHGIVSEILDEGQLLIEFTDGLAAPYWSRDVELRN